MSIESELVNFLENNIKDGINKLRDIEIIKFYYGLNESPWPTLEETAHRFNIGSRQRIEQLLNDKFRDNVGKNTIPSLQNFVKILHSQEYWQASEFIHAVHMEGLSNNNHIKGIFNLIKDVDIKCDFKFYTVDLKPATRSSIVSGKDVFLIRVSQIKIIRKLFKIAQNLPGRCGIANLEYIKDELGEYFHLISLLIESSDNSWIRIDGKNYWYIFENRANTIINYSEKVFGIIHSCNSYKLATAFDNALKGRSHKYPYPPIEIIEEYLKSSIFFINTKVGLTFIGEKTVKLNDIEEDLILFFDSNLHSSFTEVKQFLVNKGHEEPYVVKSIHSSPLVYVDKSRGRLHYIYSFIGQKKSIFDETEEFNLYKQYVMRLRLLLDTGTDDTKEQIARKEQHILQEWLFKGKMHENCAICGQEFSVKTLVAAHKKPRSDCNDAERLNPYIVMPVCLMGCDYLYENMYIYIDIDKIKYGLDFPDARVEYSYIEKLIGRTIDAKWLLGDKSFFRLPKSVNK